MTATLFAVFATDRPDKSGLRASIRETHRAYLRQPHPEGTVVVLAGPTVEEGGGMNGTLLVVQAKSVDAVRRFLAADPYLLNDLFATVEIREWRCGLVRSDVLAAATPSLAR
jgi:uncharacterized protein